MGAFALVALLAGGPLGMCFALAYGVVSVMKIAKVDAEYAKRGETTPGARLIEKWLDGRKARGQAPADATPAKYGMWRYFWQRWQAMWEIAAEEAKARHRQELKDRVTAAENGEPVAKPLGFKEQAAADWQWVVDLVKPKAVKPTARPTAAAVQPAESSDPGPRIACEDCGQTLVERGGFWEHPSSAGCPNRSDNLPGPDDPDDDTAELDEIPPHSPAAAPADSATTNEGEPMTTSTSQASTQQSGEVVGLMSAINYAAAVASAHEAHSSGGGEMYMASLAQAKVGPETIQSAGAAQEATENAAAAWRVHEAKLKEQLAAKEATTAETGDKDFLLAE